MWAKDRQALVYLGSESALLKLLLSFLSLLKMLPFLAALMISLRISNQTLKTRFCLVGVVNLRMESVFSHPLLDVFLLLGIHLVFSQCEMLQRISFLSYNSASFINFGFKLFYILRFISSFFLFIVQSGIYIILSNELWSNGSTDFINGWFISALLGQRVILMMHLLQISQFLLQKRLLPF